MQFSRKLTNGTGNNSPSLGNQSSHTSSVSTPVTASLTPSANSQRFSYISVNGNGKNSHEYKKSLDSPIPSSTTTTQSSNNPFRLHNEKNNTDQMDNINNLHPEVSLKSYEGNTLNTMNSRTSSAGSGSVNSLSFENMILPWDPTDPAEWTMDRIVSWFKFYEFPDSWIKFFERHQIHGQKFIKLLAYDNFIAFEKYLPSTKNATYPRFQQLLKDTMSKNVLHHHSRSRMPDKTKVLRTASESSKVRISNNRSLEDIPTARSSSDSTMVEKDSTSTKSKDKMNKHVNSHKKTKSTSSLYRRSFISLRSAATGSTYQKSPSTNIKLNIPSQNTSNGNGKTISEIPSTSPPLSPSIFRRHQKSNSSESSLLNFLFGSTSTNGNTPSSAATEQAPSRAVNHSRDSSIDTICRIKYPPKTSNSNPSQLDDKTKIWDKIKRRSQNISPVTDSGAEFMTEVIDSMSSNQDTTRIQSEVTNLETDLKKEDVVSLELITDTSTLQLEHKFDSKYYPTKGKDETSADNSILLSQDNIWFKHMDIGNINSVNELKERISSTLDMTLSSLSVHITDFNCTFGDVLPDDILNDMITDPKLLMQFKFYIKGISKLGLTHVPPPTTEQSISVKSLKSKASVKSITNSSAAYLDQASTITTSPETTSLDDQRRYPQTPSNYYDLSPANSANEERNYWNLKEKTPDENILPKLISKSSSKHPVPDINASYISSPEQDTSSLIYYKGASSEIELHKSINITRAQIELEPKREAPKAPTKSPPKGNSSSRVPSLKLKRSGTQMNRKNTLSKSPSNSSKNSDKKSVISSETAISSYTPGSTQVLVPQPYKGASESSRKHSRVDEFVESTVLADLKAKRSYRANSISSVLSNRPSLLKRGSSKRIVSSASAADIFEENNITFADAPQLSDSESNGSFDEIIWLNEKNNGDFDDLDGESSDSSGDIIWSTAAPKKAAEDNKSKKSNDSRNEDDNIILDQLEGSTPNGLARKMTLRPSPEEVYSNLEKFFPSANLDKPVLEGVTPPTSPNQKIIAGAFMASVHTSATSRVVSPTKDVPTLKVDPKKNVGTNLKDMTASPKLLKRTKTIRTIAHEASKARKESRKLKRHNTKMWGTRIFEVTDKQPVPINKSKNSKGEYNEFAWMKGEMIGKGSFGAVFLAMNITTGEMMAVKQVEVPKYGLQNETVVNTVDALRLEVSTLKDLDHLNIVQYLGFEAKNGIYSLFLEYVAGGSVGSLIRMYGRFDDILIRHLTIQVLQGLSYLHSRGILHRDMKADNLLLDQDGVCKISDFGISRKSNDIYSNSEMTMKGTVFWMAPEMVDTKQGYSAKVDIWSLGCIVLEMFAGKRPWSNFEVVAAMFKIGQAKSAPPIPEDTLPLISENAKEFLDCCFEIDPEKRPTADKLLSHPFSKVNNLFDFKKTKLAKFIKSNDKLNSSELRVPSQERKMNELEK
ncbi:hypothetical protein Kpol_463p8 [Vanderwaltozyma polyspora DSM 70294]|uniref:Protein kinase domain-containing protein n=1 Tax=Vanderwaltozyma polyspora (strain ATCC 22028 / DSM 70294 / BCRC 21397 / CBS 2163 / NBRC 10782 / NRRL Y-8283 / UCD 57-17) TaxID=436907 RepID=A7TQJ5_VANPO|nr:uncharacterized protein Kpol_463p8 [Vanderwaltozyma polyspora DSM 70294]EDO15459.1 hypothetical protein Kpol_463p8 [Vanderwaltozyma polyspora DSM 70294]